ncbi:sensor histidine kinase [Neobacillus terrae]|uniref:sensor histidine kinase n=1 Tax=Neobacillus terrae TaxID=3034837 RepID=UPI00140B4D26|nr:HAMP domain-containing sensor histidine kinase [Neobacillus terrae]NHM32264.1 HAMP domain-containing histidine kinase [Neobacillus terrae]
MGTKWRNRWKLALLAILFTFGLSGVLTFIANGTDYLQPDYFKTPNFLGLQDEFVSYLKEFELNETTKEEAKKSIMVTKDEIEEHRNRYGNLTDQIINIKGQYDPKIEEAKAAEDQVSADTYRTVRDKKIADITKNFQDEDYVKQKVIKEKEKKIDDYFAERESSRPQFLQLKSAFKYYIKNNETDKVYTNLNISDTDSPKDYMNNKNMLSITHYSADAFSNQTIMIDGQELLPKVTGTFDGWVGVSKSAPLESRVMQDYHSYKTKQMFLLVYTVTSVLAFLLSIFLGKSSKVIPLTIEKWRPYYNKLPIDSRAVLLGISGIGTILFLFVITNQVLNLNDYPYQFLPDILTGIVFGSLFMSLALLQGKLLIDELKDWSNVKKEWERGLVSKGRHKMKGSMNNAKESLQEAFLNQSFGTQLLISLAAVFIISFVLALFSTAANIPILMFYFLLLLFIGIPLFLLMVKKAGYFNTIIQKTNELAAGRIGPDLPVSGKSVLSILAGNINELKQGVKKSQTEFAKSERLKTELITNVSHDLRTPLTSIITYTELLKADDIPTEDREAYLEIIDRKSKRLKVLIDDLFEVSKMASGNMELTKEKINLVELLNQALAEHDSPSNLQFRLTVPDEPVYSLVDGQKLWRVFDNLIQNIYNYSLENSRVYINLKTVENEAIITFKNVSKYELSENVDELFERFKRGDKSRHTNGSGLGLAIAQSIVDFHGGVMAIEADGDLFKVTIILKKEAK